MTLVTGAVLQSRYVVKGVASFERRQNAYLVRDVQGDPQRTWVAKEVVLGGFDEEDRRQRRALFVEAVHVVASFDHARLCKIRDFMFEDDRAYVIMDYVEGVSLDAILHMGDHGVREASALRWARQICEALDYLHRRQPPYVFCSLTPSHVILTPRDGIVLVNFGLSRFFIERNPTSALAASTPEELRPDYRQLGNLLLALLTMTVEELALHVSPLPKAGPHGETLAVMRRLLELDGESPFERPSDILDALDAALVHLPARVHEETAPVAVWDMPARAPRRTLSRVLAFGTVAIVCMLAALWGLRPTSVSTASMGARLWVVCGDDAVRTVDGRGHQRDCLRVPGARLTEVRYGSGQDVLALADTAGSRILLAHPATPSMRPLERRVRARPRNLLLSEDERCLFFFQGTGIVTELATASARPIHTWRLGGHLEDMALSPGGRVLYVSDPDARLIHTLDLSSGRSLGPVSLETEAGPMLVDPDGRFLWVVSLGAGRLMILPLRRDGCPTRDGRVVQSFHDYVLALHLTPDSRSLYALCRDSHQIAVVDRKGEDAVKTIDLVAWRPKDWTFGGHFAFVVSEGSSSIAVIDTDTNRYVRDVALGVHPQALDVDRPRSGHEVRPAIPDP